MHVTDLTLANIRGFTTGIQSPARLDFERPDGSFEGWTVIAGRNGSGKTTLLRSIALALAGPVLARSLAPSFQGWISFEAQQAHVRAAFSYGPLDAWGTGGHPPKRKPWAGIGWVRNTDGPEPAVYEDIPQGTPKVTARRGPWYENPQGWFLAGYGPFRRISGAAQDAQRNMLGHKRVASLVTLFDESASLAESLWWLQEIYPRTLEGSSEYQELLENVLDLLNDGLLPDRFRVVDYNSDGLWIERDGVRLLLEELSDGFRVVAALVLDIVRRSFAAHGQFRLERDSNGSLSCPVQGVVLIDEVDVHLHVAWQQRIGFWLRSHFPRIQFIVSTHSPFICQAASPHGLIRLPAPGEEDRHPRFLAEDEARAIVNGTADRVVVSELFGLSTPYSERTNELRDEFVLLAASDSLSKSARARFRQLQEQLALAPSAEVALSLEALARSINER